MDAVWLPVRFLNLNHTTPVFYLVLKCIVTQIGSFGLQKTKHLLAFQTNSDGNNKQRTGNEVHLHGDQYI